MLSESLVRRTQNVVCYTILLKNSYYLQDRVAATELQYQAYDSKSGN